MAIIHCPGCSRRISNQVNICPHCELPLAELSDADAQRMEMRRWRKRIYQAANLTYLAMTALIAGAVWWWLVEPSGWVLPPPIPAIGLVLVGVITYVIGRGWLLWLRLPRNRPY